MHPLFTSPNSGATEGVSTLLARELGAARLEQSDFLFNRVGAVVKNLLAEHFPSPSPKGNPDRFCNYFIHADFDPANPLMASVTVGQKLAVKTLLGIESREAQEAKIDALKWTREQFDKVLDGQEQSYTWCFEEIWKFFRRLYRCGQGKVIAHFYVDTFRGDWAEQAKLELFIEEIAEADLLAAKPEALELMAFAANSFFEPFKTRTADVFRILSLIKEMSRRSIHIYSDDLRDRLISRLASLGVPFAENVLVDRALTLAECRGEWSRFNGICQKLAELGNSSAQKCFGEVLEERLRLGPLSAEDLSKFRRVIKWFFEKCPVTSCDFLARALELGRIGQLAIDLSAQERLDRLKRRFSVGDESAGSALSRIYVSNQIGDLPLNLSAMERVEAITALAESSSLCSIHKTLTNIYNTNRIGQSALSFTLEERYKRIEALAQKGSKNASQIMLSAYLHDQLSLPAGGFSLEPSSEARAGEGLETLSLNLTHEVRFGKLYALALAGCTSAIDVALNHFDEHRQEFDSRLGRTLLFSLLMRRPHTMTPPLEFSQSQMCIIDLLGRFYAALVK